MGRFNDAVAVTAPRWSQEEMRTWCGKHNRTALDLNSSRWLYVSKDQATESNSIKVRTGADALDVTKLLDGWYPDFIGWEPDRLDREFRILRQMLRMGMPEEESKGLRMVTPALPRPHEQLAHHD